MHDFHHPETGPLNLPETFWTLCAEYIHMYVQYGSSKSLHQCLFTGLILRSGPQSLAQPFRSNLDWGTFWKSPEDNHPSL